MNSRTSRIDGLISQTKTDVTIGSLVDLNAGIDYRYNKNVKVFLNINNLTNNQYQRWLNMPVLGVNVIGGLGITF
jgi:outer membrane receptor protein involved in Fe transport